MGLKRKVKKMSGYKKSLIIFSLVLIILIEGFLLYVNNSLKAFEIGDAEGYLINLIEDMQKTSKKGNIEKYFDFADFDSNFEKTSDMARGYKELLNDMEVSYKKVEENKYQIYANEDILIATVTLELEGKEHRLGLLSYDKYKIKSIESYNQDGLYEIDFYLMDNYELYLNGVKVSEEYIKNSTPIKGYEDAKDYENIPKLNHYRVTDLTYKPEIEVKDDKGVKVPVKYKDNDYYAENYFYTDDASKAMEKLENECDPLEFAKNWSLFLTADLPGTRWGLYTLTPNLIEGTELYQRAYAWATQVDITFTSLHTLDKETFTNTKVSNFTVYNENAFSVEVYLEKNMTLVNGEKRKDVLHEILYYVYHDGSYRVVSMKSA